MGIKSYIPKELKNYLKLISVRRSFKHAKIDTPNIGANVYLGKEARVNSNAVVMSDVKMDDYSYINNDAFIGKGTKIGKYCSLGYGCKIGLNEHPMTWLSTSPKTYGHDNIFNEIFEWEEFANPVVIGNDVWIGSNAIVMQGVKIGNGAVVASGAVVTKDVQPYAIVGGVPTKVIKMRFSEEKIEELQALRWWDMTPAEFKVNKEKLMSYMN